MSQVAEQPASPRLPTWPVYAVAAATVPLTVLCSTVVFVFAAMVLVLSDGGATIGLEGEIDRVLRDELSKGLPALALGIAGNAPVFLGLPLMLAARGTDPERARRRLGLVDASIVDIVLATLGLLALTSLLDSLVSLAGQGDYGRLAEMRTVLASAPDKLRFALALVVGVGAGVPEELFFRGFVLNRLAASQGRVPALVASSFLFGLFHFDALHAPLAVIMGFYLGYVVMRTRSVYTVMFAHVVNNALFTLLAAVDLPDALLWVSIPGGLLVTLGCLLAIRARHPGRELDEPVW